MIVAWRLALRDVKRGGRGLILLALCLFLGTATLAGIGSLSASLLAALDAQSRQLLGGDVELIVSQRRATVEELTAFAAKGRVSETVSMRAMADKVAGGAPTLVELRAVDSAWPLVGHFRLAAGAIAARPHGNQIAVAPALADRLGAKVGDSIRLGNARLRIIGLIAEEPDRLGAGFVLGPPILVDMDGLDATMLVQPGSLYESRYRIALTDPRTAGATADTFAKTLRNAGWDTRTSDRAASGLRRGIAQLGQFLLLVGLAALVVAGVGVGSGVSAYLGAKTRIIATLKVLGARSGTITAIFLLQLGIVAGGGIGVGLALGALFPAIVMRIAGDSLPIAPIEALYPLPLATAFVLALLVGLLAALPALARARQVPAASLLRDAVMQRRLPPLRTLVTMAALAVVLVAAAILTATDRLLAAGFVGATASVMLVLLGLGIAIRFAAARLPRPRRPLLRLAIGNLHRPGAQTDRLILALGLGFSLFVSLAVIDTSLSAELAGAAPAKAPRFFAIDLQPEDAARFREAVEAASPGATIEAVPSLRGSIVALKGMRVADMKNVPEGAWVLRGDRTLTWSATVPARNVVVDGQWWPTDYRGPPLVSLEESMARTLGLGIGDSITVSVLGVDVPARIGALRRVDWSGLGLNFALVFSPGYIEEAPHGLLASVYSAPASDGLVARNIATVLPSVTMIRTGDIIGQIGTILGQLALAVRSAAAITIVAGIVVLVGAIAASGRARRYDTIVLKLVGGSRGQILAAQAIEYALLSLVLVAVALAVGLTTGWYVVVMVFALPWAPDFGVVAATLALSVLITLGVGVAGSLPALRARPAEALRDG